MNIHPIIDEPPSFPQTVLRLLTGSTHCCDWCEKRWIKVHRTGQLECRNRRCPYCGHRYEDSYECGGNDEYFEEECEDCEREFYVTRIIDISYDTKPKEATEE